MTDDMKTSFEKLKTLTPKLNVATDAVNRMFTDVERFLESQSVGLPTGIVFNYADDNPAIRDNEQSARWAHKLAYDRCDGKFRIVIKKFRVGEYTDPPELSVLPIHSSSGHKRTTWVEEESVHWSSAPRHLKLKAAKEIARLLEAIAWEAQRLVDNTNGVENIIAEFVAANESIVAQNIHPRESAMAQIGAQPLPKKKNLKEMAQEIIEGQNRAMGLIR